MRYGARQDTNQDAIEQALAAMGWGVRDMSAVGNGFPDLLCVKAGRCVLIEVKNGALSPSRRKLTPDECVTQQWFQQYGVEVLLIEKVADLAVLDREARAVHEGAKRDGGGKYY